MQEFSASVPPQEAGKRLDVFLFEFFKTQDAGLSRTRVKELIDSGCVMLSGRVISRPHYKTKPGESFVIRMQDKGPAALAAEDIPLETVYEDKDLAVINKACGIVVHPGAGNREHTLVNALMFRFKELSSIDPERPGIVHRLDKETSGLLVIAKNNISHQSLARQFAEHSVERTYVALVKGRMEFDENFIEAPIGRHPHRRKSMSVQFSAEAKEAKTYYRTIKRWETASLLELRPYTGRTHQIRVHLAFIGHPVMGDSTYGKNNEFSRLALHAKSVGFIHPRTGKPMHFTCDLPPEFDAFMRTLK